MSDGHTEDKKEAAGAAPPAETLVPVVGAETDDEPPPRSLFLHLLSQLRVGMDLSRITLPTFVLEPRSLLEKLTDFLTHGQTLIRAGELEDPVDRLLEVTRWFISGYHVKPKGVKKPYNPTLGETFECTYAMPDSSKIRYFAEQVSHHPPVSAFMVENRQKNLLVEGYYYPKSRFLGNSAASMGEGHCLVQFLDRGETYLCTWPNAYARGIIFGTFLMEIGGKVDITSSTGGLSAVVDFKTKPMFGGEYNRIEGRIRRIAAKKKETVLYRFSGKWNGEIHITNEETQESKLFFEPKMFPIMQKIVVPEAELPENSSRRIWSVVTKHLFAKEMDAATAAKTEIEEKQRKETKERQTSKIEWVSTHFKKVVDKESKVESWLYIQEARSPRSAAEETSGASSHSGGTSSPEAEGDAADRPATVDG